MWMPEASRAGFIDYYPWTFELDMYRSEIDRVLPAGMRTPALYYVHEADADHYAMWCEFIHERPGRWELADYRLAARLLGQLAARRRDGSGYDVPVTEVALRAQARGSALHYYAQNRVVLGAIPHLRNGQVWAHPLTSAALSEAADPELPSDLLALGDRIPELLDMLDALPQTYAHGDASPQNLLRPADEPATIVVIDWGFGTLLPVGFDLGQLLVGLANTGDVDPAELPAIDAAIFPAYLDGLAAEGYEPDAKAVRSGYIGGLVVRSALCTLPLELLAQGAFSDDAVALFVRRMQLARRLLDMSAELDGGRQLPAAT
jgi:tRNA A-37 threonylcarbamoyl transferase component Bud32